MTRNEQVLALRLQGRSYQEIGRRLGISRQRVQQLVRPPPAIRQLVYERAQGACEACGVYLGMRGHLHHRETCSELPQHNGSENLAFLCIACHRGEHPWGGVFAMNHLQTVTFRVPPEVIAKLDERARKLRRSRGSLIRQYIEAQFRYTVGWGYPEGNADAAGSNTEPDN